MLTAVIAMIVGLALLVWSADRFVAGSAAVARHFGMSALLIGMVIVGFGTSAPEMVVSALASFQGNPGIALGNAYGSNITNIALILGLTALLSPIAVHSQVLRKELPVLIAVTALAAFQLFDGELSRLDAVILLIVFLILMTWTVMQGMQQKADPLAAEIEQEFANQTLALKPAIIWLVVGLVMLIISSRLLIWGAIDVAMALGVDELIIGLTIVAVGTSLPELASSLIAIRKKEHDIAIGNVLGSNLFNTLAVVGIAGVISPLSVPAEVLTRDITVMAGLTVLLFVFGYGFRHPGHINRLEGGVLLLIFMAYTSYLVTTVLV